MPTLELSSDDNAILAEITVDHKHLYRLQRWGFVPDVHTWLCTCNHVVWIGKKLWTQTYVGNNFS